jgi:hypothetical protein
VVHGRVARAPVAVHGEEVVSCWTTNFVRPPGSPLGEPPADRAGWDRLASLPSGELAALGLRRFGREEGPDGEEKPGGRMLWVFPVEWYPRIPAGLPVVDIFFRVEPFEPGVTDDDYRFGCLSYGVLVEEVPCPSS